MKNKKMFLICGAFGGMFIAACIAIGTAAWFAGRSNIDTKDKLGGSVLQSYFHTGNGTEEKPFTITTPWHYENFVKLHYSVKGFATKGYFFEFGDYILDSETPVFYKTDDHGVVDKNQTSTTLNLGGKILPPLGTFTQPFFAQVEGNNLTVSNFTVNGSGYNDVGIFGYVASAVSGITGETQQAMINQCYWKSFTINTKGSIKTAYPHTTGSHEDKVEVGYLAGHVVNASSFTDCYINDCEISGSATQDDQNNTYSYYGKAEVDAIGGETGKGYNYKYHLDSEAIYRSINSKYDNVKNAPIRARTEVDTTTGKTIEYADYHTPIMKDGQEDLPEISSDGTTTKYPISSALVHDGNLYTLQGASRGNGAVRNYSFSSLGYQPLTSNSSVREYEALYKDSANEYQYVPENIVRRTDWDNKTIDISTKDSFNTIGDTGDFYYHNGSEWRYIHSENSNTDCRDAKSFTINLSTNSTYNLTGFAALNKPSIESADFYLYIDGVQISHQNIKSTIKASREDWATRLHFYNISLSQSSFTVNLKRGVHYYCYFLAVKVSTNQGHYSYLCNSSNSVSITTGGRLTCTGGTFTVTQDLYDSAAGNRKFSFDCTKSGCSNNTDSGNPIELYSIDSRAHKDSDIPPYVRSSSFQKTMYGRNLQDKTQIITLGDSGILWRKEVGSELTRWIAYYIPSIEVDYNAITQYFADDPNITTWWNSEGKAQTGYHYKNIDIVGGGISFYYRNFPLIGFAFEVIQIRAESSSAYSCYSVPAADIAAGAHFYATKYCPTSIVLYLKNTANAADEQDHDLGKVTFEYVNLKIGSTSLINLSTPSFKKGSGVFQDISQFGSEVPGGGTVDYRTTFTCNITELGAKQCCYCALDKNGNILGVFDTNGNPSTGFIKDGQVDIQKLLQIDTYVLALGTNSNLDINTWVTNIDFEYKAKDGYGGTFGSVGYRDSDDTIESTILNFYYDLPALTGTQTFSIKVKFVFEETVIGEATYSGYYEITASSSVSVTLKAYNYQMDSFFLKINGTNYFSDNNTVTIGP